MTKIGLFFGSFNPVHIGHLIIANYMVEHTDLQEVWLVVTPHNPHKNKATLANNYERLHLVNLAIQGNSRLRASDIEFKLPQPSYTIHTLAYLTEKFPDKQFVLIMGSDNLASLPKWKNYEQILEYYQIYVYQRSQPEKLELAEHPQVKIFPAPLMEISSSFIRRSLQAGRSVRYLVPESVFEYLENGSLYKK